MHIFHENLCYCVFFVKWGLPIMHATFVQNEVEMLKSYTITKDGFSESFLHVEKQFIPKKIFASWPLEGRANQCRPKQPIWAEGLDWPALVSPALKRTRWKNIFGYKFFFYM